MQTWVDLRQGLSWPEVLKHIYSVNDKLEIEFGVNI
jgi:hypothetical protein